MARVNVYSQELTDEVALVDKKGTNRDGETEVFHAVRFYLHSAPELHDTDVDDDRSAITFWLPKSASRKRAFAHALATAARLAESLADAQPGA